MAGGDASQGIEPENGYQDGRPAEWRPEGPGRWTRTGAPRRSGLQSQPCGAAAAEARPPNGSNGPGDGGAADNGKGGPGWGNDDSVATAARGATDAATEGGEETRAGKHRRRQTESEARDEERVASDARRAQELRRQLEQAAAAQERSYRDGNGGFGSEAALSMAAQSFVLEVQRAQAQAGEMGVEARAQDGRSLLELSPAELRQWVHDNLEDDAMGER